MSSKAFTAQIFRWLHQVNADGELPASAVKVAVYLCSMFNEDKEDGTAWPSCKTIADAICKSEATVIDCVRQLEERGHLRVVWGKQGRGCSNRYWMIIKPQEAKVSGTEKPQKAKVSKRRKPQEAKVSEAEKTLVSDTENLSFHPEKPWPAKETLSKESSKNHRKKDSPPDDEAFEAWWCHYPKKVAKGQARKTYQAVIRKGAATEAELLSGVMRYAHERTDQDDKYTKYPATWLNAECWLDAPAASPARKGSQHNDNIARGMAMVGGDDDAEVSR
jgi:hypothetical protein